MSACSKEARSNARETAEVLHNVGDSLDPLARALHELGHVVLDVMQVYLFGHSFDLPGDLAVRVGRFGANLFIESQNREQETDVSLDDGQVVGNVGKWVVDFMCHAGAEHSQRGEFFGLDDPTAHLTPLDELADLGSQVGHHLQDGVVGAPGLVTEKLDHAQAVASEQDGDGEGRVQSFFPGHRVTRRVKIVGKFGDPNRLAVRPNPSGKAGASLEG